MTDLDALLARLCLTGVRSQTMAELGTITRGKRFVWSDVVESGVPCIHYAEIYTKYGAWATHAFSHLRAEQASRLRFARPGDVIIASAGETVEDIGKAVAWLGTENVVIHDACYAFRSELDSKYVTYFLQTDSFHRQARRYISSSKISSISTENLGRVRIPVPPLAVQREIVRVLDSFQELERQLRGELDGRQQQYAYYRELLTTFDGSDGTRRVAMNEFGAIFGGLTGKSKADFGVGDSRYVPYVNVLNNLAVDLTALGLVHIGGDERQKVLQRGDVLFTGSSETAADVALSSVITDEISGPLYLNSFCIGYRPFRPDDLVPEFAKHLFRSSGLRRQLIRTASGVTRFNVSKARLAVVEIPIPPRKEQRRIASVLDNFETLASDRSVGLPAEIAARRAQFKYYRDRLLTFDEATA